MAAFANHIISASVSKLKRKEYEELLEPMQVGAEQPGPLAPAHGQTHNRPRRGKGHGGERWVDHRYRRATQPPSSPHLRACETDRAGAERNGISSGSWGICLPRRTRPVRSKWENRAGVEKVMGYCTSEEYDLFLKQAPVFEKLLVDDGILLYRYWLTVDQEQQERALCGACGRIL